MIKARKSAPAIKPKKMQCVLLSWEDIYEYCRVVAGKVRQDKFRPDIIIAIARGGYVPARNLCDQLAVADLASIKVDHWGVTATKDNRARLRHPFNASVQDKNVLVVDDLADTGESFKTAVPAIQALNPRELRTATVFLLEKSKYVPDYYAAKRKWAWMIFPWNFTEDMVNLTHKLLGKKAVDAATITDKVRENYGITVPRAKMLDVLHEMEQRGMIKTVISKGNHHEWRKA
ncbi:MAG: phosphoribosyltransferase [Candidatus Micrarchaeia archaeon]|jgi:hypoxanthine phosphoribosyltransferase